MVSVFDIDKLIAKRKEKAVSRADIVNALNVSRSLVALWEQGKRVPSNRVVCELSKLLDCDVEDLITIDKDEIIKQIKFEE